MNRCIALLVLALATTAPAQAQRLFERTALRGEMQVVAPPLVQLNGKDARLAPGARIRNVQNMIQLSGSLVGRKLRVNYRLDDDGQLHDVWILSNAEAARQPWPRTFDESQTWLFDSTLQRWSRP